MNIQLRQRTESDSEFFIELFSEIKGSELGMDLWPMELKKQIIAMQFFAFEQNTITRFPLNFDFVILYDSKSVGRLQLYEDDTEIRVINISLSSAYRNMGIGSTVLKKIIRRAISNRKCIFLEVDKSNPANELYTKLGFKVMGENEINYSMKYNPCYSFIS
jgi:ribosomal protein S18 acetylase RimI-like enzyme